MITTDVSLPIAFGAGVLSFFFTLLTSDDPCIHNVYYRS